MKQCHDCGRVRPAAEFHANASHKDGLSSYCRSCDRERNRRRREKREHPRFRWPILRSAHRKAPTVGRGSLHVCQHCPDLTECRTLAWWGMPVRCEGWDVRDMLRKQQMEVA